MNKTSLLEVSRILLVAFFAAALASCSGTTKVESDMGLKDVPDWVNKGTNILNNKDGRLFHGVASAKPLADAPLQKSVADDRARAEVARILTSYLEVVSDDYVSAVRADGQSVSEESISRQIKATTKVNLRGARIIANWRDSNSGIIYSLCELDMDHVKSTVAKTEEMDAGLKNYFRRKGNDIFDRVVEEIK
ncbi:MAG TPA: hypothetical protein VGD24_07270 [Gallionella sp.]